MNKVISFIGKYWSHPIALMIYAAIIIYIIYRVGKSKGTSKPNKLPKDTDWGSSLSESESTNIRRIVERLHRDMDSWQVSSGFKDRDKEVYIQYLNLGDKEFMAVSNDFNDLYYSSNNGKLYQWIFDESFSFTAGASGDLRESILRRMEKLNLV